MNPPFTPLTPVTPIIITGIGAITPYGAGVETLWQALLSGQSAISDMDLFDLGGIACTRAGVIRDCPPPPGFEHAPRATRFAAAACREALDGTTADTHRDTALITASNFGDMDAGENALTPPGFSPADAHHCAQATTADALAEAFGLGGPRLPLSLSCSSGASAIATAANLITNGHARRVLVVGYDALSRYAWSGLCSLRTMTKDEVRPFDLNRSGTIFSEGAAALLIERADLGAAPLAHLRGWATGNNGFHMTAPAPRGAGSALVMREALRRAALPPAAVGHINAHGTATKPNDATETQAIHDVFGGRAASIPVTSVKGLLGHLLGAAGAAEAVVSVLTLRHGIIPPTGNLREQDPEIALDIVTAPRALPLDCVLSNSAGFGGCNAAIVLTHESAAREDARPPSSTMGMPYATQPIQSQHCPIQSQPGRLRPVMSGHSRPLITALGAICALGADAEEIALALAEGEPPPGFETPDADLADCGVTPKPFLDRASHLFLAACGMAFRQAGLTAAQLGEMGAGIFSGTAWGCLGTAELFFADYIQKGPRLVKPMLFPHTYTNTPVSLAAMEWSLTGPHENFVSGATASGAALVEAFGLLCDGTANAIAVGGVDALSATRLRACATQPQGEAAATLLLETPESAASRGARPIGRILGAALAPDAETATQAALAQAGLTADAVDTPPYPATLCGDVQGATTLLHTCLALLAGHTRPCLILTSAANTHVAIIVAHGA
ncbi:MAG: beta-ketoacyl-[acyl-carrier-protein] synthase family protein [Kiritimatiellaeota bacterium]|nr:beta-ketoacyl-[acyl-carrier-protein] synthase family protein [Kiritimatiellota bacterium]